MPLIGGLPSGMMSTAAKTKRVCSDIINANSAGDTSAIMYTTVPITVTAIRMYTTANCLAALRIDVGVNGDDDAIASAVDVGATTANDVDTLAVGTAAVAADLSLTASVETVDAGTGFFQIMIEYTEND